jgi:hypothetical protein
MADNLDVDSWADENPWPRDHFRNKPRVAAELLSRSAAHFLTEHLAGKRPAVPDCVWSGDECWIIEWPHGAAGWRINAFAKEVAAELAKMKSETT